jgi:hypothetical protein
VRLNTTYVSWRDPWRAVLSVFTIDIESAVAVHSEFEMLRVEKSEAAIPISKGRHR